MKKFLYLCVFTSLLGAPGENDGKIFASKLEGFQVPYENFNCLLIENKALHILRQLENRFYATHGHSFHDIRSQFENLDSETDLADLLLNSIFIMLELEHNDVVPSEKFKNGDTKFRKSPSPMLMSIEEDEEEIVVPS